MSTKVVHEKIIVTSHTNRELVNITDTVREIVKKSGIKDGLCNVFNYHTSAGVTINEDEEGLEKDIPEFLAHVVPEDGEYDYRHTHYFPKDGRQAINAWAHIRGSLVGCHVTVPVKDGKLELGGRQNIYFVENDGPLEREMIITVMGI